MTSTLKFQATIASQYDLYEAKNDKHGYSTTPLWERQSLGPAPSQTFFHLGLYQKNEDESEDKPNAILILRDWPRKRYSQAWSRDSSMNPGEKVISLDEFLKGEYKRELCEIFGEETYQALQEKAIKIE